MQLPSSTPEIIREFTAVWTLIIGSSYRGHRSSRAGSACQVRQRVELTGDNDARRSGLHEGTFLIACQG